MNLNLPAPDTFGLPPHFTSWRKHQAEAVLHAVDSDKRFPTEICPTGSGKSLMYVAAALIRGERAVVLTSTKGLQAQLLQDFAEIGMADIRGRNSYRCILDTSEYIPCDQGPCATGYQCHHKQAGSCPYYKAYLQARSSNLVVTNYAYWMYINAYGEGLGDFDLMICDEAHDAPEMVSSFLTVELDRRDPLIAPHIPGNFADHNAEDWKVWADIMKESISKTLRIHENDLKSMGEDYIPSRNERSILAKLRRLVKALDRLSGMNDDWAWDWNSLKITFCPIQPKDYCEDALFLGIPRVVMTSATVRPKTLEMLGISLDDADIAEYPHTFPVANRRMLYVPTVRMNYKITAEGLERWLKRIDQIVRRRLDRKGIIHTVSYDRRNMVMRNSKYAKYMYTHDRGSTEHEVKMFKRKDPPAYLVSPSITTGYDFPGETAEFQIIGKIAYPDSRNRITKARIKADPEYGSYIAMQQLVQACGRIIRSKDDIGETFIIDNNITWFLKKYASFAPKWFKDAYRYTETIPKPITRRRD